MLRPTKMSTFTRLCEFAWRCTLAGHLDHGMYYSIIRAPEEFLSFSGVSHEEFLTHVNFYLWLVIHSLTGEIFAELTPICNTVTWQNAQLSRCLIGNAIYKLLHFPDCSFAIRKLYFHILN